MHIRPGRGGGSMWYWGVRRCEGGKGGGNDVVWVCDTCVQCPRLLRPSGRNQSWLKNRLGVLNKKQIWVYVTLGYKERVLIRFEPKLVFQIKTMVLGRFLHPQEKSFSQGMYLSILNFSFDILIGMSLGQDFALNCESAVLLGRHNQKH